MISLNSHSRWVPRKDYESLCESRSFEPPLELIFHPREYYFFESESMLFSTSSSTCAYAKNLHFTFELALFRCFLAFCSESEAYFEICTPLFFATVFVFVFFFLNRAFGGLGKHVETFKRIIINAVRHFLSFYR